MKKLIKLFCFLLVAASSMAIAKNEKKLSLDSCIDKAAKYEEKEKMTKKDNVLYHCQAEINDWLRSLHREERGKAFDGMIMEIDAKVGSATISSMS